MVCLSLAPASQGHLGAILGVCWRHLGSSSGHSGPRAILDYVGVIMDYLDRNMSHLGAVLGQLGPLLGHLGANLHPPEPAWRYAGAIVVPGWVILAW